MHRNRTGSRYEELSVDMDVSQGGSQGGRYEAKEDFEAGLRRSTLAKDETDLWASLAGATVNVREREAAGGIAAPTAAAARLLPPPPPSACHHCLQGLLGGPAQRRWLHVDALGTPTLVEVDKHLVVQQLGVRYRDLLTLDPTVPIPFPAAILIRPKARSSMPAAAAMLPLPPPPCPHSCPSIVPVVPPGAGGQPRDGAHGDLLQPVLRSERYGAGGAGRGAHEVAALHSPLAAGPGSRSRPGEKTKKHLTICAPHAVPKASDEHLATYPTLDSPFIRQLCRCLRTGKSTATLHDLSRTSAAAFDFDAPYEL